MPGKSTASMLSQILLPAPDAKSLIQPGKPTQNGFIESFNGRFRNECLNEHWFSDIVHAIKTINEWRQYYNVHRPHTALKYQML